MTSVNHLRLLLVSKFLDHFFEMIKFKISLEDEVKSFFLEDIMSNRVREEDFYEKTSSENATSSQILL